MISLACVLLLSGCAAAIVPERSTSDTVVVRQHFTNGTSADADQQATLYCGRYNRQARFYRKDQGGFMTFNDNGEYNYYYYMCIDVAAAQAAKLALAQKGNDETDHQTCLSYGLSYGTPAYADCRLKLKDMHLKEVSAGNAAADAARTQATMQQFLQNQQKQTNIERGRVLLEQSQKMSSPSQQPTVVMPPQTCVTTGNVTNCR